MSFLSILKSIGGVVAKDGPEIGTVVGFFNPAAGAVITSVSNLIIKAEGVFTEPKSGESKKQFVLDAFNTALPLFQQVLAARGETLQIDTAQLSDVIDGLVASYNGVSGLVGAVKIVPLTPTPTA